MIRLPRQWRDWCAAAGLKPDVNGLRLRKYKLRWFSLYGHGRHWRVNSLGEFQMSEKDNTFDRWANSTEATAPIFPRNKREFVTAVFQLTKDIAA